jgi:hypothetical protein
MKIRELIAELLKDNDLEDEIIVDWFDRNVLLGWLDSGEYEHTETEFRNAWIAIQEKGQNELSETISNNDVIYTLRNLVFDEILERRKNG